MALNARFPAPSNFPVGIELSFNGQVAKKVHGRKALDFVPPTLRCLQYNKVYESALEFPPVENDVLFAPFVVAPRPQFADPFGCVCTRMMRLATNKQKSPVMQVTYMPNANRALTGAKSGEFTLWNCQTLSFETVLQAHDNPIRRMLWSHDNAWLLSADELGYVKYWQSNMMNVKAFQAHSDAVCGLTFGPFSTKFASGSDDGSLAVWDFETTHEVSRWKSIGADVKCCAWHPKTSLIVCGTRDMQQPMRMYDVRSTELIGTLYHHKAGVTDVRWNPFNSNWLLSSSHDALVKLLDIRMMKALQTFRGHKKDVTAISWHPVYETLFVSGGYDGSLLYWVYGFDKEIGRLDSAHEQAVWSAEWHPMGHLLITSSNDTTTRFWTRLRPGEYDSNTARGGGATVTAAAAAPATDADVAAAADDEDFDNAYGLTAAQWQWPDYQQHQQHSRTSNSTTRERGGNEGENTRPFSNYPPHEHNMSFGPRNMGQFNHPRRMQAGMFPPNFDLSSVLSRFSNPSHSMERGSRGASRFRGSPARHSHSGSLLPRDMQENAGMQRPLRPVPPHMNWSRLQLLDQPAEDAQVHRNSEDSNYPEFSNPPPHDFTRQPPSSHRFAPPPSNAFLSEGTRDRRDAEIKSESEPQDEQQRMTNETSSMESGQKPSGDVVGGKFLLPDPTGANQIKHEPDDERRAGQPSDDMRYGERDNFRAMEQHRNMQQPPYRNDRREGSYMRHEFAGGGGDEEYNENFSGGDGRFSHPPDEYYERFTHAGGGPARSRGFGGRRGDNRSGRPYRAPPSRGGGGRRPPRDNQE